MRIREISFKIIRIQLHCIRFQSMVMISRKPLRFQAINRMVNVNQRISTVRDYQIYADGEEF